LFPPERILVVTSADQAGELQWQTPEVPAENFVLEPEPRGTAAAIGLAAVHLKKRDPQAVMAVLTSDHFIGDEAAFRAVLAAAEQVALEGHLVTLGIHPEYPATGYGYVQRGEKLGDFDGSEAYRVMRFIEKPDEARAREMLAAGDHDWNSGMFIWRVERVMAEFERQLPELYVTLGQIEASLETPEADETLKRAWIELQTQTIDYGVMEGAERVAVIPASGLGWNDVGSWASLFEVLEADEDGNIYFCANNLNVGARNSMVHAEGSERLYVMIGVENLVVVDTGDVVLVCSREHAQDVKKAIEQLKGSGKKEYL